MDAAEIVIIVVNIALALGCGWPLAVWFTRLGAQSSSRRLAFAVLFGVYVAEAVAFAASMGTDILSVGLAVVWGLLLGVWLPKSRVPVGRWRRLVQLVALYTSLPAISFLSVPIVTVLGGWSILSSEAGARFGVPDFLPPPLNTILGFCVLVAAVAVGAKVVVTVSVAAAVSRLGGSSRAATSETREPDNTACS